MSGLGLLVKESYPLYVFIPALFIFVKRPSTVTKRTLGNILLGAALALGVASIWYWPHWVDVRGLYALNRTQAVSEQDPMGWNFMTALYYPNALLNYYLHPLFMVLLLGALIQNWKRAGEARQAILLWLAGSYFILSFLIDNKDVRHLVPCAPAIALLVSDGVQHQAKRWRRIWLTLLLATTTVYFLGAQWGIPRFDRVIRFRAAQYDWKLWDGALYRETVPHRENWNIAPLIERLKADATGHPFGHSPVRIGIVPFLFRYTDQTLRCYANFQNFSTEAQSLGNAADPSILLTFDYVITKSGDQGIPALTTNVEAMNSFLKAHASSFTPLASFALYDGSTATVLKKISTP